MPNFDEIPRVQPEVTRVKIEVTQVFSEFPHVPPGSVHCQNEVPQVFSDVVRVKPEVSPVKPDSVR